MSDSFVAWSQWDDDSPTHAAQVGVYGLTSGEFRYRTGPNYFVKEGLAIDGAWLLWTQTVSGIEPTGPADVYAWNLVDDSQIAVAAAGRSQVGAAISDGVAVWRDDREGYSFKIYKRALPSGVETPLDWTLSGATHVALSGATLVYAKDWAIHVADLVSRTDRVICSTFYPYDRRGLDVDGGVVVWTDMRDQATNGTDIYAYDLASGTEVPVCTASSPQDMPRVSDGVVVWHEQRDSNIMGYEIATGSEFPVCDLSSEARWEQAHPDICGDRVVWTDRPKVGEPDIYTASIRFWDASVVIDAGAASVAGRDVDLTLSAARWSRSVSDMRFSPDGASWSSWQPYGTAASLRLSFGDGTRTAYAQFRDVSGEVSPVVTDTVLLDTTAPVTSDDGDDLWHAAPVTLTLTPSDGGSGVSSTHFTIDGGPEQVGTSVTVPAPSNHSNDGAPVVTYWSIDEVGNSEAPKTCQVRIDTTPPASSATNADALWHAPTFVLTIASQDGGSGVATIQTRVDGGGWTDSPTVNCPEDGEHAVEYRAVDRAGNVEAVKSTQVKTDVTPPTTTCDAPTAWQSGPVTVLLSGRDAAAGIGYTEYRLDGASWQRGTSVLISGDGSHTLAYRSVDNVGNVEASSTSEILIDTKAPLTAATGYAGWHKADVAVSLVGSDAGAGTAATHYRLDGGPWLTGETAVVPAPSDHSGDGTHTLSYYSVDRLGHQEAAKSCTVRIDTRAPVVTARSGSDNRAYPYAVVRYGVSERLSPDVAVEITIRNSSGAVVKTLRTTKTPGSSLASKFLCELKPGTYSYRVQATDRAGNTGTAYGKLSVWVWWRDAAKYRGQTRTVLGPVKSTKYAYTSSGRPTFLNIGRAYPYTPRFTAVIWGRDRGNFSVAPERRYAGHLITVRGKIRMYGGQPQAFVSQPSQMRILK